LVDGAFNIEVPQRFPCSLNQTILGMINASMSPQPMGSPEINVVYQLDVQELELLSKFQTRTVLTIGTDKGSLVLQNVIIKLASSVSTLSSCLASDTNFNGSASILDVYGTDFGIDA
jgi:hypothetical protein